MKKCIVALVVGLILLAACDQGGTNTDPVQGNSGYVTRETTFAQYEILYGWELSQMHSAEGRMLYFPAHMGLDEEPSYVIVEIMPTGQLAESLEDAYEEFLEFIELLPDFRGDDIEIVGHEVFETHFGGAIVVVINDSFEDRAFVQTQYYLIVDDFMAVVSATQFFDDDVEDAADMARHIVDTIRFNNLEDIPVPELPPNPFGGEWQGNVFTNPALDLRVQLPDNWTPFTREMIVSNLGMEVEQYIQVMASSDNDELLQVMIVANLEQVSVPDFLQDFAVQFEEGSASGVTEVEIAGQSYYTSTVSLEDGLGESITQQTFARKIDDVVILSVSFLHIGEARLDTVAFLEEALGQ